jgi:ATP-dependent DNA helicase Q1
LLPDIILQDTETLLIHLLTSQFLAEIFKPSQYATNVYIILGPAAPQLARLSREQVERGNGPRVMCSFRRKPKKTRSRAKAAHRERGSKQQDSMQQPKRGRPHKQVEASDDDGDDEGLDEDSGGEGGISDIYEDVKIHQPAANTLIKRTQDDRHTDLDSDQDDDFDDDWNYSMRAGPSSHKRQRRTAERPPSTKTVLEGDIEFMVLSSD